LSLVANRRYGSRVTRPLRIQFPGGVYHVTARGNGRQALFADDADCERFLQVLAAVVARYRLLCHAYCLMGNHYHLLLETLEANLSRAMRQLNGVYAQHFNRRHERSGHVTEGRFHAQVIDRDSYLHEVCRYIALNPVRAALASHPRDWRWSSYRATAGEVRAPAFLTVDWVLSLHRAASRSEAERRYARFVMAGLREADAAWDPTQIGLPGNPEPRAEIASSAQRAAASREIARSQRFPLRPPLEEIFAGSTSREDRDARCVAAVLDHGYTLRAVAEYLGLHYATVSRALTRKAVKPPAAMSYFKT